MESSCRGAESRRSSRFWAVRLAMPLVRLSDRFDAQNAQNCLPRRSPALQDEGGLGVFSTNKAPSRTRCSHGAALPRINASTQRGGYKTQAPRRAGCAPQIFFGTRCYFCGLNCPCAWRRPSAAALKSGSRCSAASNSGMLSRGLPDPRRAHPRLAWAATLLGFNRTAS